MGVTSTEPVASDDAKIDKSDLLSSLDRHLKFQNFGLESESGYNSIKEPERKMGVTNTELVAADDAKIHKSAFSILAQKSGDLKSRSDKWKFDSIIVTRFPRRVHYSLKGSKKAQLSYNSIEKPERDFPSDGYIKLEGTKWKKLHRLGQGGYGTVYEVITNHEAHCAVKVVHLSDHKGRLQLQREIQMYSQYEHENIVRYLGAYEDSEKLYVFLELMPNGSLETVYKKRSLTDSEVSTITRQILNGLEFLHGKNVIHRDIKCANILVGERGSVKVADFGVAKDTNMDAAKSSVGTLLYMAPEVVMSGDKDRYESTADIWSLGCTVLEMLTRKRPYPCSNPMQVFWKVMKGDVPDVPEELPRKARDFILRCLKRNPSDRPTAAQLLRDPFVG